MVLVKPSNQNNEITPPVNNWGGLEEGGEKEGGEERDEERGEVQ